MLNLREHLTFDQAQIVVENANEGKDLYMKGICIQGGEEKGMKAKAAKEDNMGNVNVPGGKAADSMKSMPKGHGAEKKGAGDAAPDKKSMIGS